MFLAILQCSSAPIASECDDTSGMRMSRPDGWPKMCTNNTTAKRIRTSNDEQSQKPHILTIWSMTQAAPIERQPGTSAAMEADNGSVQESFAATAVVTVCAKNSQYYGTSRGHGEEACSGYENNPCTHRQEYAKVHGQTRDITNSPVI